MCVGVMKAGGVVVENKAHVRSRKTEAQKDPPFQEQRRKGGALENRFAGQSGSTRRIS
jgi:hypothetical protein